MNAWIIALTMFAALLLARHVPQVVLDMRNRERRIIRAAHPTARAGHLIAIWAVIHAAAAKSLVDVTEFNLASIVGLSLVAAGCVLGTSALITLSQGRAYHLELVVLDDAQLVRSGIYRLVRHPLRLALAIETLGSLIIVGSLLLLPFWILLVVAQINRTTHEDQLLREHFGQPALDYQNSVPAANLVAGIWRLARRHSTHTIH